MLLCSKNFNCFLWGEEGHALIQIEVLVVEGLVSDDVLNTNGLRDLYLLERPL